MNQLNQNLTFFILIIFENQWDFYIFLFGHYTMNLNLIY